MSETEENPTYLVQNSKIFGHSGPVTKIAVKWEHPDVMVTASRDKTLIVWQLITEYDGKSGEDRFKAARQKKSLVGHGHYVSDVVLTKDAKYVLSASFDRTLRLWDIETGKCMRKFISHTKDVTSVALSPDHRFIISGSRDRTVKVWNILGECKATLGKEKGEGHTDWVSSVKYSDFEGKQTIVSCGMDSKIKVWDLASCNLLATRTSKTGPILSGTLTPDSSLSITGGKNGTIAMIETNDLTDPSNEPMTFASNEPVVAFSISPIHFWLAVAYTNTIKLYDFSTKEVLKELTVPAEKETKRPRNLKLTTLSFSGDGRNLFAAYDDNSIRVWDVIEPNYVEEE